MATMTAIDFAAVGSLCGGIAIAMFNKGLTDGARNGAARVAWFLVGIAFARAVYRGSLGLIYALEVGDVVAGTRGGGNLLFHRDEHPLWFWLAVSAQTTGMVMVAFLACTCIWKALKKGG
ncbi:hypothetical protein EZM97_08690 [Dyella soli]|uniref:Uncharacterized protein n=1 Tax=Dyella soli TaxID=522319 RepID=A0A4R0Z0Q2_9GAMM|nr:hypothetical protein EZM97_08690 [Dyella soli]